MKKLCIIAMAVLALLTAQCKREPKPTQKVMVPITGNVDFGGSKTEITTAGYITPVTGDMIYIYNNDNNVGSMTCTAQTGQQFTCSGEIDESCLGKPCTFMYLGTGSTEADGTTGISKTSSTISFANQTGVSVSDDGKIVNLNKFHVGSCQAQVSSEGTVTLPMATKMSIAYFQLKDEGGNAIAGQDVTISGVSATANINKTEGTLTGVAGNITVHTNAEGKFYMALIPNGGTQATFSFAGAGKEGSIVFPHGIGECNFYSHQGSGNPLKVTMEAMNPQQQYVDLGLPSGLFWAICNVGAETPSEVGDYFAWGETAGYGKAMTGEGSHSGVNYSPGTVKTNYSWDYYKWASSDSDLGKYNSSDAKVTLDPEDDAACVNWGGEWRMPTKGEFDELVANTTRTYKNANETIVIGGHTVSMPVNGVYFVSSVSGYTDRYVFFPSTGYYSGTSLQGATTGIVSVYCWSSTLFSPKDHAWLLCPNLVMTLYRYAGLTVRAVRTAPSGDVNPGNFDPYNW